MKKALSVLTILLGSSLYFAQPTMAATNICNASCQVNEDCGQVYRCYVGVCRNELCPSSPTCGCTNPSPSPTMQPQTRTIATASATPVATTSGKTITATTSANLTKTPVTGPKEDMVTIAFVLFAVGMALYAREYRANRA